MEVPAGCACRFEPNLRFPKYFCNQVNDIIFNLESASNSQKAQCFCQDRIALKDAFPCDNVHESGFVFQGHEDNTPGGSWPLATDNQARISNIFTVFHGSHCTSIRQPLPSKARPDGFKRVATRAVRSCPIVPLYLFKGAQGFEKGFAFASGKGKRFFLCTSEPPHVPERRTSINVEGIECTCFGKRLENIFIQRGAGNKIIDGGERCSVPRAGDTLPIYFG